MGLRLVTPAAERVVSLAEAKAHLRVDHPEEDGLIGALLDAAIGHLDGRDGILGRALVQQTLELTLDAFPAVDVIELPLPPLVGVTSVQYLDVAGAAQTLAPAAYVVDGVGGSPARIVLAPDASWPDTRAVPNAVTIRFVAGYGAATAVPAPIKAAILLLVGHLYRNREATTAEALAVTPLAVDALTAPFRVFSF